MNWSIVFWLTYAASLVTNVYFGWPNGKSIASTVLYHALIAILGVHVMGAMVK